MGSVHISVASFLVVWDTVRGGERLGEATAWRGPAWRRKRLWGLEGREKDKRKRKRLVKGRCGLCHPPAHCPVSRGATLGL